MSGATGNSESASHGGATGGSEGAFPFRFRCRRSGNCCARPQGIVRVTAEDVRAIAAHVGLCEAGFRSRYLVPEGTRLRDGLGGRCPFLAEGREAACTIHAVRPEQCRTWPFWPELLESPELLAQARRTCPGIEYRELVPPLGREQRSGR